MIRLKRCLDAFHRRPCRVIFILALLIVLPGLGQRDIVNSHEARVVQTARTMAYSGWPWEAVTRSVPAVELVNVGGMKRLVPSHDRPPIQVNPWIVPVMNGVLRLQKPPLPYWCSAICIRLLGDEESSARLPSAILSACSAVLLVDLTRSLWSRRVAWLAGLAWLSLYFVYDEYRKAMADPYLACCVLLAVWGYVKVQVLPPLTASRPASQTSRKRDAVRTYYFFLLVFYAGLGLGLLSKGPVALLHVGLGVTALHLAIGSRPVGRLWPHALGVVLLAAIALPWPLILIRRLPMAPELWWYESIGEFGENQEKPRGPLFYLSTLALIVLPWLAVWLPHVIGSTTRWWLSERSSSRRRRELFAPLWVGMIVVVMSFSHVKKNAYLLPLMPAIAMSIGLGLNHILASLRPAAWHNRQAGPSAGRANFARRSRLGSLVIIASLVCLGLGISIAMPLAQAPQDPLGFWTLGPPTPAAVAIGVALAVPATVLPVLAAVWKEGRYWPAAQAAVFIVLITLLFRFVNTPMENRRSAKPACMLAVGLLAQGGRTLATEQLSEEVAVYLPVEPLRAVQPDALFASRVLYLLDDSDRMEARARNAPYTPFNPIGWQLGGGKVIAFRFVVSPETSRDVRWKLYEFTIDRTALARSK